MKNYKEFLTFIGQLSTEGGNNLYYFPLFLKTQNIDLEKIKDYESDMFFSLFDETETEILRLPLAYKNIEQSSLLSVRGYIPFDEKTKSIQFEYQGKVISTLEVPKEKLSVKAITKLPNYIDCDNITLEWESFYKGDHSLLEYKILYSNDGDKSWQRIGDRTKEHKLSIDTSTLVGGDDCRFLIQVTDGYNNANTELKGFNVQDKPYEVMIVSPLDGDTLSTERSVLLNGQCYNPNNEEEIIDGFHWSSSIDGELGSGSLLQIQLTKGEHIIRLHVGKSQDSICLHVE